MDLKKLDHGVSVTGQITPEQVADLAAQGFGVIINNRPDGEEGNQPDNEAIAKAAAQAGVAYHYLPLVAGQQPDHSLTLAFGEVVRDAKKPVLAFCRTGRRSGMIHESAQSIMNAKPEAASVNHQVVVVGGGTAGISVVSSLLKRMPGIDIAVIEPSQTHDYQAAWTLVGAGEFNVNDTRRPMARVMPKQAKWIVKSAVGFEPEANKVILDDGSSVGYDVLIVCPGLKLNWAAIEGLEETLGKNGVTSNYGFNLAPYTWELVKNFKGGDAIFTQPPMPIKCAGAPQKAMYLSCSHWEGNGVLAKTKVQMFNAGAVLFGVADFVPPLMEYVKRYNAQLNFTQNLIKIDGPNQVATFKKTDADGNTSEVTQHFDMIHVVPPQCAPDFVAQSPLAAASGWVDVDQNTMQHVRYPNVFSLGDAGSMPNAKTTAAVRKQSPIVAGNVVRFLNSQPAEALYDGYGACPLTVEKGKIVLAEFSYGGKLAPTFPLDPTKPRGLNWFLKATVFPKLYWDGALKGHEWLTACRPITK